MSPQPKTPLDPKQAWECQVLKHDRQLVGCAFSPCGKYAFAGGVDNLVHRWDLASEKKTPLAGHASWIHALAFTPDQKHLITADYVGGVCCWEYAAASPKPKWTIQDAHTRYIRSICVSPGGKWLVTAGDEGMVRVWNASNGKLVHELAGHEHRIYSTAFHPDGKSFVTGDRRGFVKHWDAATGKRVRDLDATILWTSPSLTSGAGGAGVLSLAFDDSGATLGASGVTKVTDGDRKGGHASILLIDWKTGKETLILKHAKGGGFAERALFHPSGFWIAACLSQDSGSLEFWTPDKEPSMHSIPASWKGCRDLALHPDGQRIAVAQWERNGGAGNVPSTKKLEEYTWHHGTIRIYNLTPKPEKAGKKKSG